MGKGGETLALLFSRWKTLNACKDRRKKEKELRKTRAPTVSGEEARHRLSLCRGARYGTRSDETNRRGTLRLS